MRGYKEKHNTTDLIAVLQDVQGSLDTERFDRRLVIIASDFVHDPDNRSGSNVDRWNRDLEEAELELERLLSEESNTRILPLKVDANLKEKVVADAVLGYLQTLGAKPIRVDFAASSPQDIAGYIHEQLLDPLTIISRFTGPSARTLDVTVRNPNCQTVTLNDLRVSCGGLSANGDLQRDSQGAVPPVRGAQLRQLKTELRQFQIDDLGCPAEEDTFSILATQLKGPDATDEIVHRNDLKARPTSGNASRESFLGKDTLRLYMGLRGQIVEPQSWVLKVKSPNSDSEVNLVEGRFEVGRDLDRHSWQTYRIVFPGIPSRQLEGEDNLLISIEGAEMTDPMWPLRRAEQENRLNLCLVLMGGLTVLGVLLLLWYQSSQEPVLDSPPRRWVPWTLLPLVLLVAVWGLQRFWPDANIIPGWKDGVQVLLTSAALGGAVYFLARGFYRRMLTRLIQGWDGSASDRAKRDRLVKDLSKWHRGNLRAIGWAVFAASVVGALCLWSFRHDPGTPRPPENIQATIEVYQD